MTTLNLLAPPEITPEERESLVDFVLALRKPQVQGILKLAQFPTSGTMEDLRGRLKNAIEEGRITSEQLVDVLDAVAPWGKQHVFLFTGPAGDILSWKDPEYVRRRLEQHGMDGLFNSRLPLVLPKALTLSSITHADGRLRVTAVQKRAYLERVSGRDWEESEAGDDLVYKVYVRRITRTLVAFEWDMDANSAMLQITQLDRDTLYEKVATAFFDLVGSWLDRQLFGELDVRPAIRRLQELEESGPAETRSHVSTCRSPMGKRISVASASPRDSALSGEDDIDRPLAELRRRTVPHLGNFYWLAGAQPGPVHNPLKGEVHVTIVGSKARINFATPNTEDVIRYVLHRVRTHC